MMGGVRDCPLRLLSFRGVAQRRARNPFPRSLCRLMDSGFALTRAPE